MASSFISSFGVGVESIFLPEVHSGGDADYKHYVQQEILLDASFEQIPGDEETVVGVEDDEKRKWNNAAMAQVFHQCYIESSTCHHHERKCKYNSPADDVNQRFDDA